MRIVVERKWETATSICGEMSIDGQWECYTLERPRAGPHPCIPAGTYDVILSFSPHLLYVTPEILNVTDRTHIRIHIANQASELEGCTAVGTVHAPDYIENSRMAFEPLMTLLRTAVDADEMITITYIDPQTSD